MKSITINSTIELAKLLRDAHAASIELERKRHAEGWHGDNIQNMVIYIARKYGAFGF